MKVKIPPEAKIQAVAGTLRAALLLRRICYWHHKTKITREGRLWICKTREEWGEEAGLTFDQVKRALVDLREAGVIVTTRHTFYGLVPNFLRLTADAVTALGLEPAPSERCETAPPTVQNCTIRTVQNCTADGAKLHHPNGAELHHP